MILSPEELADVERHEASINAERHEASITEMVHRSAGGQVDEPWFDQPDWPDLPDGPDDISPPTESAVSTAPAPEPPFPSLIETAPRDGTKITGWTKEWGDVETVWWRAGNYRGAAGWTADGMYNLADEPTHWEPFAPKIERPSIGAGNAEAESILTETVEFAREAFQLPDDWSVKMTIAWGGWRWHRSFAGVNEAGPFIRLEKINMLIGPDHRMQVADEYGIYRNDPVIGQIKTTDWKLHLRRTIVHEVAHAIQTSLLFTPTPLHIGRLVYEGLGIYERGHSSFFQAIYRILRVKLLNHLVPQESIGKPGAKTRLSSPPEFDAMRHPLVGTEIIHGSHGRSIVAQIANSAKPHREAQMFCIEPGNYHDYEITVSRLEAGRYLKPKKAA